MKRFLLVITALVLVAGAQAQTIAREAFKQDIRRSANNYQAYPDKNLPKLTPAPEGYKPFFMNHYGRHGSRWLISPKDYTVPVEQLTKGERNGKLTKRGKDVLAGEMSPGELYQFVTYTQLLFQYISAPVIECRTDALMFRS